MTVNELRDQLGGLDPDHCEQVRRMSVDALAAAPDYDAVRRLYKQDHESGTDPSPEWVEMLRCQLEAGGIDYVDAGQMDLGAFVVAIKKLRTADRTDKKTDNGKNLPPKEVMEVARYIRAHWELVAKGKAHKKFKKTLIKEAVGEANWEAMDRQLRRYKGCLTLPDRPDK